LKTEVIRALHNERVRLLYDAEEDTSLPNTRTWLLFPYVTNALGYDTGIAIANTGADPF
jgi:hypothetical protein